MIAAEIAVVGVDGAFVVVLEFALQESGVGVAAAAAKQKSV